MLRLIERAAVRGPCLVAVVVLIAAAWLARPRAAPEKLPALELAAMRDDVTTASREPDPPRFSCELPSRHELAAARQRLAELRRERDALVRRMAESRREHADARRGIRISSACLDNPLAKDCL